MTYALDLTGESLVTLREDNLGLTQKQMSDLLGSHEITISRWECGVRPPPTVGSIPLLLRALAAAAHAEPRLDEFLPRWLERGRYYFWSRVFRLAAQGEHD